MRATTTRHSGRLLRNSWTSWISNALCSGKRQKLVDQVHAAGKKAMMFLGDTWIGIEPYGKYFSIGLDAVVGSVGDGATLRMLAEIPGIKYTEGRFLPYFFVFSGRQ